MFQALKQYMYRHLPDDRELRFRANLLLGVLLTIVLVGSAVVTYFAFVADLQMEVLAQRWATQLTFYALLFYLALMALLLRGYYRLASYGTVLVALSSIGIAVLLTGGAPSSPALPLLLLAAVISFCLLGGRAGSIAALLIPVLTALQWYAGHAWGWQLPNLRSYKNPGMDVLLCNLVNYVLVIMVLLVYERISANLRRERDEERQRLAHFATHDELTGLANRRHFHQRLEESCARCDRGSYQVAVLYIDLDGFKKINDELGHKAGDVALREIAGRLKSTLRRQDLVARLGGDEFAVIIDPFSSHVEVEELCQRLRNAISEPLSFPERPCQLGASIGMALYPSEVSDVDHVLSQADAAMYKAKRRLNTDAS